MKEEKMWSIIEQYYYIYIYTIQYVRTQKSTMYLKHVLVLPLHKVLAMARTILTLTDTMMHACWKWQEEIAICWAHCLDTLDTHIHTYTNTLLALCISLRLSLHITVMRFENEMDTFKDTSVRSSSFWTFQMRIVSRAILKSVVFRHKMFFSHWVLQLSLFSLLFSNCDNNDLINLQLKHPIWSDSFFILLFNQFYFN